LAIWISSASSATGPSLPGRTGTPTAATVSRALDFSPISVSTEGFGPMKVTLQALQTSANAADSERNP